MPSEKDRELNAQKHRQSLITKVFPSTFLTTLQKVKEFR